MKKDCAVIVPIYKDYVMLSSDEVWSYMQLLTIFPKRQKIIVTSKNVDILRYIEEARECGVSLKVEIFDVSYFQSTATYNELMLSSEFYRRFLLYDYMLIYQLDAYVFEDKLDYWMSKEYDYIGAPWFTHYGDHESGDELWEVGNGGLSLRRVKFYYDLLTYKFILYRGLDIKHGLYQFIKSLAKSFGYHNTIKWHKKYMKGVLNEDCFLSYHLKEITNNPKFLPSIPSPQEAIAFAFEKSPSFLFEKNGRRLPMGCHAFMKYEYKNFWSAYIKNEAYCNNNQL